MSVRGVGARMVEGGGETGCGCVVLCLGGGGGGPYPARLDAGVAGRKSREPYDIAPAVTVALGDDVQACRETVKPMLALYIGGMGARGKNFYNDLARRYGYEDAAREIQDLYLDGKKKAAAASGPGALVDEMA